jgi:hypothetical protein
MPANFAFPQSEDEEAEVFQQDSAPTHSTAPFSLLWMRSFQLPNSPGLKPFDFLVCRHIKLKFMGPLDMYTVL